MKPGRRAHRLPLLILVVGLVVFAGLSVACRVLYGQTEDRLLQQRTNEAASVLQVSVSQIRAPLDSAAELADVTEGDPAAFARAMQSIVGTGLSFTSAALFRVGDPTPVAQAGEVPALIGDRPALTSMLATSQTQSLLIVDLLDGNKRRLGYAVVDDTSNPRWVVYGERTLSDDANVRRRTEEPFAQLDYAIYLGDEEVASHLLGSSLRTLPISGRRAASDVAFGDNQLHLVMTPIGHLSSDLFADLWMIVAAVGFVVSLAFALLTRRLIDRNDTAMALADDNERLYDDQRQIAETLQLSLLPQVLQAPADVQIAARYWPAGSANLIGGDFYDAFRIDERRWAVTIGDVCGKGIEAAALTGLARHTIRAAARTAEHASDVLRATALAMSDHVPPTYCTACFMFLTVDRPDSGRSLSAEIALGGHPQPILHRAGGRVEHVGTYGTILGMIEPTLTDVHVEFGIGDVLVLYTDGLTDAPKDQSVPLGEVADLLDASSSSSVEQIADDIRGLKRRRRPQGSADDTALIVLRHAESAGGDVATSGDTSGATSGAIGSETAGQPVSPSDESAVSA